MALESQNPVYLQGYNDWQQHLALMTPVAHQNTVTAYDGNLFYRGSRHNFNPTPADGDYMAYDVIVRPGTWKVGFQHVKYTNMGIIEVHIDDVQLGSDVDGYVASIDRYARSSVSGSITKTGKVRLKFKVNGKNASSTDYGIQLTNFYLRRTGA